MLINRLQKLDPIGVLKDYHFLVAATVVVGPMEVNLVIAPGRRRARKGDVSKRAPNTQISEIGLAQEM